MRLGHEAESPRGRLYLMRAVAEGRVAPSSPAFAQHLDGCLGCRACETACPAGVEYGALLEQARATIALHRGLGWRTRLLLWVFGSGWRSRLFGRLARLARGLAAHPRTRAEPPRGLLGSARFGLAMLAGSRPWAGLRAGPTLSGARSPGSRAAAAGPSVAILDGCVQAALFGHVNRATARVLAANGCRLVPAPGQRCCGALHAHAGDLGAARALALENIEAFERSGAEVVVTNAAGCGAALKEYPRLFDDPQLAARARAFSARVQDISQLLAALGPRPGAPVPLRAAYDAPCHLQHAQRLAQPPLAVLSGVPGLEVAPVSRADECCGGAGIYALLHPELGGRILADKVKAVGAAKAQLVVTANPGCMLQIAAGLAWHGAPLPVLHVVELLDESYRRAGLYGPADEEQ